MCKLTEMGLDNAYRRTRLLWLSGMAALGLTSIAHAQFYALTDLGTLGGTNCLAYAINNLEQIVGASQTEMGDYHAFMFQAGNMMDLGTLGGSNSWAYGINDNGWVVGASEMPMGNMHGFVTTSAQMISSMMDLGTAGGTNSAAWMINMHNQMVGWTTTADGSQHAFVMTNMMTDDMMDLGTAGGLSAAALCINSNGMVVGYSMMTNGTAYPIMSTNAMMGASGMMMMDADMRTGTGMGTGTMGMGSPGAQSTFVNDIGMVVGQTNMPSGNHHAVVTANGGMMGSMNVDLGTLGGSNSVAYCANSGGIVVGTSETKNGLPHAFMMTNVLAGMPQMMDLNDLVPTNSGWTMMEARGINAAGQIVGWGMHNGQTNGFLLTPVAGPTMMTSSPQSQIVGPQASVTLQMGMTSSETLTYQWTHDGIVMPDQTNAALTIPQMGMQDSGLYTVTARNSVGTVSSSSAAVGMFSMNLSGTTVHLTIGAPTGSKFRIEHSEILGPGASWRAISDFTMMGSMQDVSDTPPQASHARFYRAVMLP
jgi:probable HAF family extracellular repeat protein